MILIGLGISESTFFLPSLVTFFIVCLLHSLSSVYYILYRLFITFFIVCLLHSLSSVYYILYRLFITFFIVCLLHSLSSVYYILYRLFICTSYFTWFIYYCYIFYFSLFWFSFLRLFRSKYYNITFSSHTFFEFFQLACQCPVLVVSTCGGTLFVFLNQGFNFI